MLAVRPGPQHHGLARRHRPVTRRNHWNLYRLSDLASGEGGPHARTKQRYVHDRTAFQQRHRERSVRIAHQGKPMDQNIGFNGVTLKVGEGHRSLNKSVRGGCGNGHA